MASTDHIPTEILTDDGESSSQTVASFVATDEPSTSDKTKSVVLRPTNCLVILNGQKCQLRINPESGILVAYPVKDEETSAQQSQQSAPAAGNEYIETRPITGKTADEEAFEGNQTDDSIALLVNDDVIELDQEGCSVELIGEPPAKGAVEEAKSDSSQQYIAGSAAALEPPSHSHPNVVVESPEIGQVAESAKVDKLPVPELIIPSVGGKVTSLAITQQQVTGVAKLDEDEEDDIPLRDPKLTLTSIQAMKPVLSQFLIAPPHVGDGTDDGTAIGIKTSGSDLEKLKCVECSFQAYYPQQYEKHLREKHSDDLQKCKCCGFVTLAESELISHYTEIHPRNICELCHYVAEHAYVIKRHMFRHSAEGCTCEVCGKVYKDQYILKMHVKMVHTAAEVLYQCDICSKRFSRKAHLKRHTRTHNTDRAFGCPHCDYRGCERSDVTKHMLIHEAPKLVCDVCGKTFRHQKNKDLHMKRHTGQRDFKCGVCDFFGYTFTDIRKHIERRHTEWKASSCDKCGAVFKTERSLQEHITTWHQTPQLTTPASGSEPDAIIFVDASAASGQMCKPSDHTLTLNTDGSVFVEEQIVMSRPVAEESVVEFTSSDMEATVIGEEHFSTHVNSPAAHAQAVSVSPGVSEMSDLTINLCQ